MTPFNWSAFNAGVAGMLGAVLALHSVIGAYMIIAGLLALAKKALRR